MTDDRVLVLKAAMAGQIPITMVRPEEVLELEMTVMNVVLERKVREGRMAFREHSTLQ
jgi:hypothetical protein